jgi:NAD(P) transhydrogenase subunit alpha
MTPSEYQDRVAALDQKLGLLTDQLAAVRGELAEFTAITADKLSALAAQHVNTGGPSDFFLDALTVLILAAFVGYYVIWNVTPALHAPLMGITNAISSVIIVGALIAAGPAVFGFSKILGFFAIILASINIFGGFVVTNRMLDMFKSKKKQG